MTPSDFARFTHPKTWAMAMGRTITSQQLRLASCRLLAAICPQPAVTFVHPRYRISQTR